MLKLTIGTRNSSFRNAWFRTFFRFCMLRQLRVWKKTIILSTVLGIPSRYFWNQRLKLKLFIGTMNSSFRKACSRTFFPFLQVESAACLEKTNNYIHRTRNTIKLLFKSKIKVKNSHWDHECQFPECLIPHFFSVSASWGSCVSGKKTIFLSNVLGITSSYFLNQRLKLKLTIGTMNYSFRIAWFRTFSCFCKLRQLRFWIKKQ